MMERHNRKSHLAPQLSPSTQALLRGETAVSPGIQSSASTTSKTPTSGDIPIAEEHPRPNATSDPAPAQVDLNGTGMYQSRNTSFDRSGFPPRSSSNFAQPSSRPRESDGFSASSSSRFPVRESSGFASTTLPIRNAGPPSGALPQPPDTAFKNTTSRQSTTNNSTYTDGYQSLY